VGHGRDGEVPEESLEMRYYPVFADLEKPELARCSAVELGTERGSNGGH
jgi:hypothetical protein